MRRTSIQSGIPCITNINTVFELLKAMDEVEKKEIEVRRVDEYGK
jgi:hypothetical protein